MEQRADPRGRPRDPSRDGAILAAALDVLADAGYGGFTVDAVAERAHAGKATLYRRWSSKPALIVDALATLDDRGADPAGLPDTGSLVGDFRALLDAEPEQDDERRLRIMAGLMSLLAEHPELAQAADEAVVGPWVRINREFLHRAVGRGEIPATTDVETLARVVPAVVTYRACILRQPIPTGLVAHLIDTVLLPAAGVSARVRG